MLSVNLGFTAPTGDVEIVLSIEQAEELAKELPLLLADLTEAVAGNRLADFQIVATFKAHSVCKDG